MELSLGGPRRDISGIDKIHEACSSIPWSLAMLTQCLPCAGQYERYAEGHEYSQEEPQCGGGSGDRMPRIS